MTDAAWERALNSAARQFESYVRQGRLETPEQRREALSDALQHAVGLLKLSTCELTLLPSLAKSLERIAAVMEHYAACELPPPGVTNRNYKGNDLKAAVSDD